LPARDAKVASAAIKIDSKGDLTSWTTTADRVEWGLVQFAPGVEYAVQVEASLADEGDGGAIEIAIGALANTYSLDAQSGIGKGGAFATAAVGRIQGPQNGAPVEVSARAVRLQSKKLCSLRSIRFVPVGADFGGGASKSIAVQALFANMMDSVSKQVLARSAMREDVPHGTPDQLAAAFYDENATLAPIGAPPVHGRDAIGKWLVAQAPRLSRVQVLTTKLLAQPDGGFVQFGRYVRDETLPASPDDKEAMTGQFVRTWRRANAGSLVIASETWWQ
jgi:hypothetical protein